MSHRYTRAARRRAKPSVSRYDREIDRHEGDEFDELVPTTGHLTVVPVRDYKPHVPQEFDEFVSACQDEALGPLNQLGPVIEDAIPVVTDNKELDSYLAAFDKRSNSQPDEDDDCSPEFQRLAHGVWDEAGKRGLFPTWDIDEEVTERWLSKMDVPKQKRMRKAIDELVACEDDAQYLGSKTLSVKVESLLKRYDRKWAPRLIYAGNDHFNALTGPVAMVLTENLNQLFHKTKLGPIKFKMAYKCQDTDVAQFLGEHSGSFPEAAEGDFSANDLRQRKFATELFDHAASVLGCPRWARSLFMKMRKFAVKNLAFGHRAWLSNQLPTGTTITTVRNSTWNATIEACYAITTNNHGVGVLLGDDFLGMFRKKVNCNHWQLWVEEHSRMKLTGATPRLSGEATFLSRRLCMDTEFPCMMPKLGKALARFNVRVSKNQSVSDSAYVAGKALSYAYEFRHFPMFRDLFLIRYRSEEDAASVDRDGLSWFTRNSGVDVDQLERHIQQEKVVVSEDETREFLMDAYGDTFGLVDALDIARRVILNRDIDVVPAPHELYIDWS